MNKNMLSMLAVAALLSLSVLAQAPPALGQMRFSVDIGVPPPPPVYETYETGRPGYVLLPGYWFWDGHQHRWAAHRWAEARPGQRWRPEHWEQRGNKHHFEPGQWERDRHYDRDGGPGRGNQSDRHRNGNNRR